ncbi:MAG: fibrobacter succinogenes major paralogous domain-containing protein [Salinivirgaceae bacterium]|nr:fibrobacter succinogenes major paralogous domain-containing protein [Salinivirgaceae bacterium]MDD4746973.1 fibrobacter succinogenes major paralogous domain-containing protein [Salinivirgaceae bacterium]MDY0280527.1 fibrobacter succinogenes major paralogous domain-containing protein [Salinivirgaceae bacterium]
MKKSPIFIKTTILILVFAPFSCSILGEKETGTQSQRKQTEFEKSETTESPKKLIIAYSSTKINNQIWMDRNLNTDTFRNGNALFKATNAKEWEAYSQAQKPTYCYMNFNNKNGETYGKLYNWYAVNDSRGLCPKGWHVPTDKEHREMRYFLGNEGGNKLKSDDPSHWKGSDRTFINQSGFNALPGGAVTFEGAFVQFKKRGFWWSSTGNEIELMPNSAYHIGLRDNYSEIGHRVYDKRLGFSVRCVKN